MKKYAIHLSARKSIYFILFFLFIVFLLLYYTQSYPSKPEIGISFSGKYAKELGIDQREVYLAILDEFDISEIKLSTYFNEIQTQEGQYNFSELDWQIQEAKSHNVNIILAVGLRTPRWPECHAPEWWEELDQMKKEQALLDYVKTVIDRYKDFDIITAWQIENEPFLGSFGTCPFFSSDFYKKEILLVRSLSHKPIIGTVSGELENWQKLVDFVDIIGISVYRNVSNPLIKNINYDYFFPPAFYEAKRRLVSKPVYITEFQVEPWASKPLTELTLQEESISMTHAHFEYLFKFLGKHQFDKVFLWGTEWWYYKMVKQNDNFYWEYAKQQVNL